MPEKPETNIAFTRFDMGGLPEYGQVQVKYTNIDFSQHTNNIEYVRFMLDTYSVRELETRPVEEKETMMHREYRSLWRIKARETF